MCTPVRQVSLATNVAMANTCMDEAASCQPCKEHHVIMTCALLAQACSMACREHGMACANGA